MQGFWLIFAVFFALIVPRIGFYVLNHKPFSIIQDTLSKEVICRRLLDSGKIGQPKYAMLIAAIRSQFENERKAAQEYRKLTGKGIPRNIPREAIDQNSPALCRAFFHGYREGYFDKQDISRYLGVKQNHIEKFMWEVSKW